MPRLARQQNQTQAPSAATECENASDVKPAHRHGRGRFVAVQQRERAGVGGGVAEAAHGALNQRRPDAAVEPHNAAVLSASQSHVLFCMHAMSAGRQRFADHGFNRMDVCAWHIAFEHIEHTLYRVLKALVMLPPFRYW